jgi:hypothetical protein
MRKLEDEMSSEHEAIAKLNDALNKLIKGKEDYETALLKKVPPKIPPPPLLWRKEY